MELSIRRAWRLSDPALERDALAFWQRTGLVPPDADLSERLRELCLLGYYDDALVGVATVTLRHIETLNCRMAMFRCAVAPEARKNNISTTLALRLTEFMEQWSLENSREGVMGIGTIIQSPGLVQHDRSAVWPTTKLSFAGYTAQGQQFRLIWFKHATVAGPPKPDMLEPIRVTAKQL